MSWAAVPTHLMDLPEWRALSNDAKWLWMAGRLYAASIESDGLLEDYVLPALMLRARVTTAPNVLFAELVANGWWEQFDGGWQDVRFLDDNTPHEKREHKRNLAAARKKKQRLHDPSRVTGSDVTRDRADMSRVTESDVTHVEEEEEIKDASLEGEGQPLSPMLAHRSLSLSGQAAERASNGSVKPTMNAGRAERIEEILDVAVRRCSFLTPKAKVRWRSFITDIVGEVDAHTEISESLVRRRAREFFLRDVWARLGDSSQARHLREHILKPVKAKRSA